MRFQKRFPILFKWRFFAAAFALSIGLLTTQPLNSGSRK
jgi:hypothetical protein